MAHPQALQSLHSASSWLFYSLVVPALTSKWLIYLVNINVVSTLLAGKVDELSRLPPMLNLSRADLC